MNLELFFFHRMQEKTFATFTNFPTSPLSVFSESQALLQKVFVVIQ